MKLTVEKCVLVGLSCGGMVGFIMAEKYPDLVKSMVVSCSVMALTESVSSESLTRIGYSCWSDLLVPHTVKGVKNVSKVTTYKEPWYFRFVYNGLLKIMSANAKERVELLEALITKDKDFRIPHLSQKKIHLLWGDHDKIFNMKNARDLEEQLNGKGTMHIIEKAGHIVAIERPFAYNALLKSIIATIWED